MRFTLFGASSYFRRIAKKASCGFPTTFHISFPCRGVFCYASAFLVRHVFLHRQHVFFFITYFRHFGLCFLQLLITLADLF